MRIFRAEIDVALGRADRERCDGHALDQEKRVALHQHPVGEGAAVALVGVAHDIFLIGLDSSGRPPFDPGREARAAAPSKPRGQNLLDRRFGSKAPRALEASKPAMTPVVIERERVSDPAAGENEPLLAREIGDIVNAAKGLGMGAAGQEARFE